MTNINHQMSELSENLNISLTDLCDLAEVSTNSKSRIIQDFKKIPLVNLLKLSDSLEVDFDQMINGQLDYTSLKEHYQGNFNYIRDRYQTYKKSKASTIHNFFTYASSHLPDFYLDKIMKRLQIKKESLQDPNMDVSGLLLMDLFKELAPYSKDKSCFFEIGRSLCRAHIKHVLKTIQNEAFNPKDVFEGFIENIHSRVEYNMEYKILNSSNKSLIVMANTRNETLDTLKTLNFANEHHYQNIMGYYSEISSLIFKAKPRITKLKSWKGANAELIFELEHPQLKKSQSHFLQ